MILEIVEQCGRHRKPNFVFVYRAILYRDL